MRIGLITTLKTNIGDDLIREGICLLFQEAFKGHQIQFISVNKHIPMSVYPFWHPVHLEKITRFLPMGRFRIGQFIKRFAIKLKRTRFDGCQLIVQCGAPVLWPNCHLCEWAEPLWYQVVGRLSESLPVLNLAAGSCYPWERQPFRISDHGEAQFLKKILGYCQMTTVRDPLAQNLFTSLGEDTTLIPCSAFLAGRGKVNNRHHGKIVLINYMSGAGHYDWNQGINPYHWRNTVTALIGQLRKRHPLAFLCHNESEYHMAQELAPEIPRLFPKTVGEYFDLVSNARVAICNRMHASVGLAGLGIPSIAVGTDTRLLMVNTIGLPSFYVKEMNLNQIEQGLEDLIRDLPKERERLLTLQSETWNRYLEIISKFNFN